jgi:Asp-tRNA(Asn)/Glu-tRNA(Gln) amidotransferase C subunit
MNDMGGFGKKSEPPKQADDKEKKPPAKPVEDDDAFRNVYRAGRVALANAPDSDGTFFKVPKVIER